eukprot:COSAG05_NODE_267_length_12595_cov_7.076905_13_plen_510_part_00
MGTGPKATCPHEGKLPKLPSDPQRGALWREMGEESAAPMAVDPPTAPTMPLVSAPAPSPAVAEPAAPSGHGHGHGHDAKPADDSAHHGHGHDSEGNCEGGAGKEAHGHGHGHDAKPAADSAHHGHGHHGHDAAPDPAMEAAKAGRLTAWARMQESNRGANAPPPAPVPAAPMQRRSPKPKSPPAPIVPREKSKRKSASAPVPQVKSAPSPRGRCDPSLTKFKAVLTKIANRKDSAPFLKPMVELWRPEELVEYFKVIKKPMDLRTVREKLEHGEYNAAGHAAFAADMRLIFVNCTTYTPQKESPFNQQATLLLGAFETLYTEAQKEATAPVQQPPVREYQDGDVVWVKVGSFPWWPGQVAADPAGVVQRKTDGKYHIHFCGDGTHGWAAYKNMQPYGDNAAEFRKKRARAGTATQSTATHSARVACLLNCWRCGCLSLGMAMAVVRRRGRGRGAAHGQPAAPVQARAAEAHPQQARGRGGGRWRQGGEETQGRAGRGPRHPEESQGGRA